MGANSLVLDQIDPLFGETEMKATICQQLLAIAAHPTLWPNKNAEKLPSLWDDRGPSSAALNLFAEDGPDFPETPRVLLRLAGALWTGRGGPTVLDVLALDATHRELLVSLLDNLAFSDHPHLAAWVAVAGPALLYEDVIP